ncbi:MAG: helix-turn-helix domain-containing protein [Paenibacillaceae bacterium]|nr:helix-turn-helix domain-containing protein [Paenibacillaceae bacterium]
MTTSSIVRRAAAQLRTHRTYFFRLLYLGLFSVFMPLLVSVALSYWLMSANLERQVKQATQMTLDQMRQRLDGYMAEVEQATTSLLLDNDVVHAAYQSDLKQDVIAMYQLNQKINLVKQVLPRAYSVDLYLPRQQLVLSTAQGYLSADTTGTTDALFRTLDLSQGSAWTFMQRRTPPLGQDEPLIVFVRQIPLLSSVAQGYISVSFTENEWFHYMKSGDGGITVIDSKRLILSHADPHLIGTTLADNAMWEEHMLRNPAALGSFTDYRKSVITTFSKSGLAGWTIIEETAFRDMYTYKSRILWITIAIGLLASLIGVSLTYMNSRRLYAPLSNLLSKEGRKYTASPVPMDEWGLIGHKWNELEGQIEQFNRSNSPLLREMFLIRLLYHYYANAGPAEIGEMCERHRIDAKSAYQIIVAEPERFELGERFKTEDRQLVLFAIANIAGEVLAGQGLKADVLTFPDSARVVLVLPVSSVPHDPSLSGAERAAIREIGEQIREAVEVHLKFAISLGIGGARASIADIGESFNEALEALRHRLVQGGNRTIEIGEVAAYTGEFHYPLEQEQAIAGALRRCDWPEATERFASFMRSVRESGCTAAMIRQSLLMLFLSLSRLSSGCTNRLVQMNAGETLMNCATSSEAEGWFRLRFLPFLIECLTLEQEQMGMRNVESAKQYIAAHIAGELSLTVVAGHVGLNPSYFSRLFAKSTGSNFSDYVARAKIEHAKSLLLGTDMTVAAVAAAVGYIEPTFRRVFKQLNGVTPHAFRAGQRG